MRFFGCIENQHKPRLNDIKDIMNPTIECILARQSQRLYSQKPISEHEKEQIFECAMRAPTAGNMMLYSIIEVANQNKKEKLVVTCDNQPFIAKAPFVLLFLADLQRWYDYYKLSGVSELCARKGVTFDQPAEADLMLACCDALIAAQTAVIAAESMGIGSCYIGDIMENYELHREMFDLPDLVFPVTMLCFGYPKERKRPLPFTPRFPKDAIVSVDSYHRLNAEEFREMFSERNTTLVKGGNFYNGAENVGQHFYLKKTGSDFFQEMRRSVKVAFKTWLQQKG